MTYREFVNLKKFSPPYGDGTASRFDMTDSNEFSPPYGDGTARVSHVRPLFAVFAPLRGWYLYSLKQKEKIKSFRPLTGMVLSQ